MRASSASTPSDRHSGKHRPSRDHTSFVRAAAAMACTSKGFTQRIHHACLHAALCQQLGCAHRARHHAPEREDGHVIAFTHHVRPAGSERGGSSGTGTPSAVPRGYRMANGPPRASAVCSAPASSASFEGASTRNAAPCACRPDRTCRDVGPSFPRSRRGRWRRSRRAPARRS